VEEKAANREEECAALSKEREDLISAAGIISNDTFNMRADQLDHSIEKLETAKAQHNEEKAFYNKHAPEDEQVEYYNETVPKGVQHRRVFRLRGGADNAAGDNNLIYPRVGLVIRVLGNQLSLPIRNGIPSSRISV
jgi:hypothetical protein